MPELQLFALTGDAHAIEWLSSFLCWGDSSICFYEPFFNDINLHDHYPNYRYLGIADPNLVFIDRNLYNRSRVVWIGNDPVPHSNGIFFPIEALCDKEKVKEIWSFCLPGIAFRNEWFDEMRRKHVGKVKVSIQHFFEEQIKRTLNGTH